MFISKYNKILNLFLIARKLKRYVTQNELNKIAFRYSARILDLRRDGYKIGTRQIGHGHFIYWLGKEPKKYTN